MYLKTYSFYKIHNMMIKYNFEINIFEFNFKNEVLIQFQIKSINWILNIKFE